jgi:hypothetical protein
MKEYFQKLTIELDSKGIAKNQFTAFMESIAHNLKRMVVLNEIYQT